MGMNRRKWLVTVGSAVTVGTAGCVGDNEVEVTVRDDGYKPKTVQQSSIGEKEFTDRPLIGDETATVDTYYWNDYLCGHCKDFELNVLSTIGEELIDDGVVNMRLVPLPVVSTYSTEAIMWGKSVWETVQEDSPQSYWVWRKTVYSEHDKRGSSWATDRVFKAITEAVSGVDVDAVMNYKQNNRGRIKQLIEDSEKIAGEVGINGTPGLFFVNANNNATSAHQGPISYSEFNNKVNGME